MINISPALESKNEISKIILNDEINFKSPARDNILHNYNRKIKKLPKNYTSNFSVRKENKNTISAKNIFGEKLNQKILTIESTSEDRFNNNNSNLQNNQNYMHKLIVKNNIKNVSPMTTITNIKSVFESPTKITPTNSILKDSQAHVTQKNENINKNSLSLSGIKISKLNLDEPKNLSNINLNTLSPFSVASVNKNLFYPIKTPKFKNKTQDRNKFLFQNNEDKSSVLNDSTTVNIDKTIQTNSLSCSPAKTRNFPLTVKI